MTERRQTMLFSATTSRKTEDLQRLAVKKEPVYVGVHDSLEKATVEGLEQGVHSICYYILDSYIRKVCRVYDVFIYSIWKPQDFEIFG